jgi:hypothetical protein
MRLLFMSKNLQPLSCAKFIPGHREANQAHGCDENPESISWTCEMSLLLTQGMWTQEIFPTIPKPSALFGVSYFLLFVVVLGGDMIITTYNNASLIVEVSPAKPMVKTCSRSLQCARYPISDRTSWTIFLTRILCCSACSMPMWRCELVTYRKQWNLVASDI